MKMRFALLYLKRNCHDRIQRLDFLRYEITRGVKNEAIDAGAKLLAFPQQLQTATVLIGAC